MFFERNGLELITDVSTGKAFNLPTHIDRRVKEMENAIAVIQNNVEETDELERLDKCEAKLKVLDELAVIQNNVYEPTRKPSWNDLTNVKQNSKSWMDSSNWKNIMI